MKILVAGIGGIGGWLAATLARGGADVDVFARGAALARIGEQGLTFLCGDSSETFKLRALGTVSAAMRYDAVVVCVKTQDFPALCASLQPVLRKGTDVVAAVNGLPWWFTGALQGPARDLRLETIDPGGVAQGLLSNVTPIGAVVHASAHAVEPGIVRAVKADRLIIGDVPGYGSPRTEVFAGLVEKGGVPAPVVGNICEEVWAKLWGNENMNPISALTRLSSLPILSQPELLNLVRDMMIEFDIIGGKLGVALPMSADERIEVTKKLGDFRTSMLADAEAGRRLEHEGILGCVVELAEKLGVSAPVSRIVYSLLKGLDLSFAIKRRG